MFLYILDQVAFFPVIYGWSIPFHLTWLSNMEIIQDVLHEMAYNVRKDGVIGDGYDHRLYHHHTNDHSGSAMENEILKLS